MMAAIPSLSSLPSAARTIFLDFDGDFQTTWNRTDSDQTYTNVNAKPFNIDNTEGISNMEVAAIRKIWETVADDFAPFNVNVTTVAPASFANDVALRVVMAGDTTAMLRTSSGATFNVSGDVFIADNSGASLDTSGYASIGSFNNAEPNVVYVFAKYMSTWSMTDSEDHPRDLRAIVATTVSHEAGHAFGLEHHGDYDVGTSITTPIMGSNTQGDRSIWSSYMVDGTPHDNIAELNAVLGARPDDYSSNYNSAATFPLRYRPFFGLSGSVNGVIGQNRDADLFRITINSTAMYNFSVNVPQFGNLDAKLTLYRVIRLPFGNYYLTVATSDPAISANSPFRGLGTSFSRTLQPGTFAIQVGSHGGYGDVGGYTLAVKQSRFVIYAIAYAQTSLQTSVRTTTFTASVSSKVPLWTSRISAGAGQSAASSPSRSPFELPAMRSESETRKNIAVDDVFGAWSESRLITGINLIANHRAAAFSA
jgi:hypothetical protein